MGRTRTRVEEGCAHELPRAQHILIAKRNVCCCCRAVTPASEQQSGPICSICTVPEQLQKTEMQYGPSVQSSTSSCFADVR